MKRGEHLVGNVGGIYWQQANDAYCRQRRGLNLRQLGETRFGMGVLQALYAPWTTMKRDSGVIVRLGRIHWALRSCREKAATGVEVVRRKMQVLDNGNPIIFPPTTSDETCCKMSHSSKCGVIAVVSIQYCSYRDSAVLSPQPPNDAVAVWTT
jgi:hypothetical protein